MIITLLFNYHAFQSYTPSEIFNSDQAVSSSVQFVEGLNDEILSGLTHWRLEKLIEVTELIYIEQNHRIPL